MSRQDDYTSTAAAYRESGDSGDTAFRTKIAAAVDAICAILDRAPRHPPALGDQQTFLEVWHAATARGKSELAAELREHVAQLRMLL